MALVIGRVEQAGDNVAAPRFVVTVPPAETADISVNVLEGALDSVSS